jgi:transaldolase
MEIIPQIVQVLDTYEFGSEVIVASIRNPLHVVDAAMVGAHVATVPYNVLMQMVKHPLTDIGIERFLADYEKIPKK